ncbi:COG1361 family protein [Streptomyces ureilyticus]|uniref:Uncharacterized protein n=1 Tax=Streptomyces ureilyticus TaxID=1775131 RepID=A0ABX0DWK7_9ACTN|nr:hypothetical protein [Streptomyces ureilyticus]NGO45993.1 hypothetical protein [Streptomyces ureilyticus]
MTNWPAWISSGAAVGGAGAAWFASINGVRTLRQTRADSVNRSRPMVAAEFRDAYPAHATLYLVVRNYGPSVAKNVRVTFTPEIPDPNPEKAERSVIPYLKERYGRVIPTLTPETELKNVYFSGRAGEDDVFVNWEDVPDQLRVTITYESTDRKQSYEDTYDLDVALMQGETRVTSSRSIEKQVQEIRKALQGIQSAARSIARRHDDGK